jgi:hypothetical protein
MRIFFETKPDIIIKERASIWLESDLKQRLTQIGKIEDVSLNHVCRVLLGFAVEEYETNERNERVEDTPWLYDYEQNSKI